MAREATLTEDRPLLGEDTLDGVELAAYIYGLREERDYEITGRNRLLLMDTPTWHVVLEVLREGARTEEPGGGHTAVLQVLQGELRAEVGEAVLSLRRGEVRALPRGGSRSLEAVQNAAFLVATVEAA